MDCEKCKNTLVFIGKLDRGFTGAISINWYCDKCNKIYYKLVENLKHERIN